MFKKAPVSFLALIVVLLFLAFLGAGCSLLGSSSAARENRYGKPIEPDRVETVSLAAIIGDPGRYAGQTVIVEANTGQVCRSSGCWLFITDGSNSLYIQFYDFTVNLSSGTPLRVQGEVRMQNQVPYLAGEGVEVLR